MRFYIVHDAGGSTLGCETTLKKARELGRTDESDTYSITRVDCPVNAETIRRLLGNLGGYADESNTREYSTGAK